MISKAASIKAIWFTNKLKMIFHETKGYVIGKGQWDQNSISSTYRNIYLYHKYNI